MNQVSTQLSFDSRLGEIRGPAGVRPLKPQTMAVLELLSDPPGQICSRDELLAGAWPGKVVADSTIASVISQLRRALREIGVSDAVIETRSKRGYRLVVREPSKTPPRPRLLAAAAVVAIVGCATLIGWHYGQSAQAQDLVRLEFELTQPAGAGKTRTPALVLSPNARGTIGLAGQNAGYLWIEAAPHDAHTVQLKFCLAEREEPLAAVEHVTPYGTQTKLTLPGVTDEHPYDVRVTATRVRRAKSPLDHRN